MAARPHYEELTRQLSAIGAVKRGLARTLPQDCPPGAFAVLTLLDRHGEMRLGRLSELLDVDMSVTSRHVAHTAAHGWLERLPDPCDGRSRILRLTPAGRLLLTQLAARASATLERALSDWTDEDLAELNTLLARLRSSFCATTH
ncbi:MarR family transcriptional regulator [Streptomyces sp. NPDC089919]|uniref:MarR family winged helix-turn-helix transcriptional regulator n=1 Tax=Streptomyces sp. NPDC089919 TaxID=3155188 RepID=UPI0034362D9A